MKWSDFLKYEKNKKYFKKIILYLNNEKNNGKIIFPLFNDMFNAFKFTEFDKLKIVIIGQDPYYKYNQSNGLCFSVNKNCKIPKSLNNIYLEILRSINNFKYPKHGFLKKWSEQGILLLNSILSVELNKPLSHSNIGWEIFIKKVIDIINIIKKDIIFLLWGKYVYNNIYKLINKNKHIILKTSHPSPKSFNKGFWGCNHFIYINKILKSKNKKIIDWQI